MVVRKTALNGIVCPMSGNLKIRKVRTGSGATAVQIVRYTNGKRVVEQHVGSAHTQDELSALYSKAKQICEQLTAQLPLFPLAESTSRLMHIDYMHLTSVTHRFAYDFFNNCIQQCGLGNLRQLYQDLVLMRIIEPTSKLRSLELLKRYFNVSYAERTVYRLLPQLMNHKADIENAAYGVATKHFSETFALVLYDVTTLYFESHKPDDELLAKGFSKDDKSKQPQVVVGLLVTHQGFPLMHEVYKGNTFEGHTFLDVVKSFQNRHPETKPIIVADAAMLSSQNMQALEAEGYQYIVGARLANTTALFINSIDGGINREDGEMIRLQYPNRNYEVICTYSNKRYKKDKHQFDKQLKKAEELVKRKEPGKRAKFVKRSGQADKPYSVDEALKVKTEKLLGIKGYCTNIPVDELTNEQIVSYYHDLWRVEQTFRMSKTDLKTRPIFHYTHDAVRAHVLLCFMALMVGKFLEIKTGLSLRRVCDIVWNVHEAHIKDNLTGEFITLRTNLDDYHQNDLHKVLKPH